MPIDKEILEYGMYVLSAGIGSIVFQTSFNMIHSLGHVFSEELNEQNKNRILDEEKRKLGLEKYNISLEFKVDLDELGYAVLKPDKSYIVVLKENSFFLTRKTLKHELYHIFRDNLKLPDTNNFNKNSVWRNAKDYFRYQFIQEPRAMTYANWGIKL